jgi:hypothetical protein
MQPKERKYYLFTGAQNLDWVDSKADIDVSLPVTQ